MAKLIEPDRTNQRHLGFGPLRAVKTTFSVGALVQGVQQIRGQGRINVIGDVKRIPGPVAKRH